MQICGEIVCVIGPTVIITCDLSRARIDKAILQYRSKILTATMSYTISPRQYRVPCDLDWHPTMRARHAVICISDLHQNDTHIGCLVARQTTDHWAHATGPWPGCDMTRCDFSYKEGNAVCVQLAPPYSYTPLASASSSPGCWGRWSLAGGVPMSKLVVFVSPVHCIPTARLGHS